MGCGLGGCYSCVIPIKTAEGKPHFVRSCLAGPVFRGNEISVVTAWTFQFRSARSR